MTINLIERPTKQSRTNGANVPLLQVRNVTRAYQMGGGTVYALRDVSLDIAQAEFVALLGPSGSGKSTLLHVLGCLDRPDKGSYRIAGREVSRLSGDELARVRLRLIGFVFQSYHLMPKVPAIQQVALPLAYAGVGRARRERLAAEALRRVGMGDRLRHTPEELSGGQQQRVSIARAVVHRPRLVIADEPTGALDTRTTAEIMQLFQQLNRELRTTVVLVTHDPETAQYATRKVWLRDGRIVSEGAEVPGGNGNGQMPRVRVRTRRQATGRPDE
jgi:putative ABC transport system ATP-binding protein